MPKFRRKPVNATIEAVQYDGANIPPVVFHDEDGKPYVVTIQGQRAPVSPGDWIITEPDGKGHYPCEPGVFADRYEQVEE